MAVKEVCGGPLADLALRGTESSKIRGACQSGSHDSDDVTGRGDAETVQAEPGRHGGVRDTPLRLKPRGFSDPRLTAGGPVSGWSSIAYAPPQATGWQLLPACRFSEHGGVGRSWPASSAQMSP
jgi:hypothetical protein